MNDLITLMLFLIGLGLGIILSSIYYDSMQSCPNIDTTAITEAISKNNEFENQRAEDIKDFVYEWRSVCNPSYKIKDCNRGYFEEIAKTLGEAREYEVNVFDCTEKTALSVNVLNDLGFRARDKTVAVNCESGKFNKSICEQFGNLHSITEVSKVYFDFTRDWKPVIDPGEYCDYGITKCD